MGNISGNGCGKPETKTARMTVQTNQVNNCNNTMDPVNIFLWILIVISILVLIITMFYYFSHRTNYAENAFLNKQYSTDIELQLMRQQNFNRMQQNSDGIPMQPMRLQQNSNEIGMQPIRPRQSSSEIELQPIRSRPNQMFEETRTQPYSQMGDSSTVFTI